MKKLFSDLEAVEWLFLIVLVGGLGYIAYEVYQALSGTGDHFDANGNPTDLAGQIGQGIQSTFGGSVSGSGYTPNLGTPGSLTVGGAGSTSTCTGLGCTEALAVSTGIACCDAITKTINWLSGNGYNCGNQPPCGSN